MPIFRNRRDYEKWKAERFGTGGSVPWARRATDDTFGSSRNTSVASGRLRTAGWVAIGAAVLGLQSLVRLGSVPSPVGPGLQEKIVDATLALLAMAMTVFLLQSLRQLLNDRFAFHGVDAHLSGLVLLALLATALRFGTEALYLAPDSGGGGSGGSGLSGGVSTVALIVGVASLVTYMVVGVRLLTLGDELSGLVRPFCYGLIAAHGLALATYPLFWLGLFDAGNAVARLAVVGNGAAHLILAGVFFRAAAEASARGA